MTGIDFYGDITGTGVPRDEPVTDETRGMDSVECRPGSHYRHVDCLLNGDGEDVPQTLAEGDRVAAQRDYHAGKWCGECRYGVVEDPPCCTLPEPTDSGREDER